MHETHPDPARARRLALAVVGALAVVAVVLVVLALATGTYVLLLGLTGVAAGGVVALLLLRSEEVLDEHDHEHDGPPAG